HQLLSRDHVHRSNIVLRYDLPHPSDISPRTTDHLNNLSVTTPLKHQLHDLAIFCHPGLPLKYRPTPNVSDLYLEDHYPRTSTRYAEPQYQLRGLPVPSEATFQSIALLIVFLSTDDDFC